MQKELTISLSDETYQGLMNLVGEKNASQFIQSVLRPYFSKYHDVAQKMIVEYDFKP